MNLHLEEITIKNWRSIVALKVNKINKILLKVTPIL